MGRDHTAKTPACCDGCGRISYSRVGWTERSALMGFAGLYCGGCSGALRTIELLLQCSRCGRHSDEGTAERNGWQYLSDGFDLHPICPDCLALEPGRRG